MADLTRAWAARIARIEDIRLRHANYDRIRAEIKNCITLSKYGKPMHALLSGPSGAGKTVLCRSIVDDQKLGPIVTNGFMRKRVGAFYEGLGSPVTISGIMESILKGLGDPLPWHGWKKDRENRIATLMETTETSIIFLDEFHHLIPNAAEQTYQIDKVIVINWLKKLLDELPIPLVLCGTPAVKDLVRSDPQLYRRIEKRLDMDYLRVAPTGMAAEIGEIANTSTSDPSYATDFASFSVKYAEQIEKEVQVKFDVDYNAGQFVMNTLALTSASFSAMASFHRICAMHSATSRGDGVITENDVFAASDDAFFEEFRATAKNPFREDPAIVLAALSQRGFVPQ